MDVVRKPLLEIPVRKFLIPFFTFWAVIVIVAGMYQMIDVAAYRKRAVPVIAVVDKATVNRDSDDKIKNYTMSIRFQINDDVHQTELTVYSYKEASKQELEVMVDPDKTADVRSISSMKTDTLIFFVLLCGAVFIVVPIDFVLIHKSLRNRRILKNGRRVNCNIIRVAYRSQNKGRSTYRIICNGINPNDGCSYDYKSPEFVGNPEEYLNANQITTMPVCFGNKRKHYCVDVSGIARQKAEARLYNEIDKKNKKPFKFNPSTHGAALLIMLIVFGIGVMINGTAGMFNRSFFIVFTYIGLWMFIETCYNRRENPNFKIEIGFASAFFVPALPLCFVSEQVSRWLFAPAVVFIVGNVGMIFSFAYMFQKKNTFKKCLVAASARIIENKKVIVKKNAYCYKPVVSFVLADGQEQISTYDNGLMHPMEEGITYNIMYNEKNPGEFRFVDAKEPKVTIDGMSIALFLIGISLWSIAVFLIARNFPLI